MKNMVKIPALLVGLLLMLAGATQTLKAQQQDVSLQSFYDELSPYGQWIQDPQYGYVWRPDVDQEEFRPYYSNGRWAMTEYGNTWVSNYDWGWAPFHYGRWMYNRYNNWVWLPGTVWAPAWVSWRSGGGQYGWAPLGPNFNTGVNIGRGGYRVPDMYWNFIPYNNIYYNNYPRYNYGRNRIYIQNTVIINNTYVSNNRTYYTGPRAEEVRRATNQNVTVYNVNRSSRPGASGIDNNSVNIYSPRASRTNGNSAPRNALQGSINRGPITRENSATTSRSDRDRNGSNINQRDDRNVNGHNDGEATNRPSRGGNDVTLPQNRDNNSRVGVSPPTNGNVNQRPIGNGRNNEGGNTGQSQRPERNQPSQAQPPQRAEGSREMPPQQQRVDRQQPIQQTPPQQQRVERTQSQPQRVERTQSAPQQGNSGDVSENRSERGGGGGRPGRG
jgi:hypothetical protein